MPGLPETVLHPTLRPFMSLARHSTLLLTLLALAADARAQVIDVAANSEQAPLLAETTGGSVEPETLPGNNPLNTSVGFATSDEPPLPEAEGPQVMTPTEQHPEEVSAIPRRFRYELSVDVRGVYDDNVTLSRGADRRDDFYAAFMPQITLGLGDVDQRQENYVSLNYAPSAYVYIDNSSFSTIEQIGRLEGQWRLRRVALTLSQDLQSVQSSNLNVANSGGGFSNQTNLDVGGRRRVNNYATRFGAAAELSGKTSLRLGADYSVSDPEGLIGSETLAGTIGLDYRYGPKLLIGAAVSGGKQFVDAPSPDTTFEQANVRASYEVTGKISASGSAGVEFRQSENGTQDNVSPIFQLGLAYAPFDGTQLDFSATRRTQNSASAFGQDFTSTQLVVSARQRLLGRLFLSVSAGIQNQSYFSTATGVGSDRDDNYYFIAPGIDVRITNFWFAGAFYTHRENDSSLQFYSFDDNQYGIRTTLRF